MNPWILLLGGLGAVVLVLALFDDAPLLPADASPELREWHEFLVAHSELRR